jgi:hypothetical protein
MECESVLMNPIIDALQAITSFEEQKDYSQFQDPNVLSALMYELAEVIPAVLACLAPKFHQLVTHPDGKKRICFVRMVGNILTLDSHSLPVDFLLEAFLRRFTDIDSNIRESCCNVSVDVALRHPQEISVILTHLKDRCLDSHESVRKRALLSFCQVFEHSIDSVPETFLKEVGKRLFDKSLDMRKLALQNLSSLFSKFPNSPSVTFLPESIVHLMQLEDISYLAETYFDEKILGANASAQIRIEKLLSFFSKWDAVTQKFFSTKLIKQKALLQSCVRKFIEFKDSVQLKANLKAVQKVSYQKPMESLLGLNDQKVVKTIFQICSNESPDIVRICRNNVNRIISTKKSKILTGFSQVFLVNISASIIGPDSLSVLLDPSVIEKFGMTSMKLALEVVNHFENSADNVFEDTLKLVKEKMFPATALCILERMSQELKSVHSK